MLVGQIETFGIVSVPALSLLFFFFLFVNRINGSRSEVPLFEHRACSTNLESLSINVEYVFFFHCLDIHFKGTSQHPI